MKHLIKVEVPLSGVQFGGFVPEDTFTLEPPCFYCGAPIDIKQNHYYMHGGVYQIRYWGTGQKYGNPMLGDVVDTSGNKLMGGYQFKFPYCPEHLSPVKAFKVIDILALSAGALAGLGVSWLAYIDGAEGFQLILILAGMLFLMPMLFYFFGLGIKAIIAKANPKIKDFALGNGHYGVEISPVTVHSGEPLFGPIRYSITLGFCSQAATRRFLAAYPQSKVIKGDKFAC